MKSAEQLARERARDVMASAPMRARVEVTYDGHPDRELNQAIELAAGRELAQGYSKLLRCYGLDAVCDTREEAEAVAARIASGVSSSRIRVHVSSRIPDFEARET